MSLVNWLLRTFGQEFIPERDIAPAPAGWGDPAPNRKAVIPTPDPEKLDLVGIVRDGDKRTPIFRGEDILNPDTGEIETPYSFAGSGRTPAPGRVAELTPWDIGAIKARGLSLDTGRRLKPYWAYRDKHKVAAKEAGLSLDTVKAYGSAFHTAKEAQTAAEAAPSPPQGAPTPAYT
jgi:hypothetical protein